MYADRMVGIKIASSNCLLAIEAPLLIRLVDYVPTFVQHLDDW